MQTLAQAETDMQKAVIEHIDCWLTTALHGDAVANRNLIWQCIKCLSLTESPHVLNFKALRNNDWLNGAIIRPIYIARFRNGCLTDGVDLFTFVHPGIMNADYEQITRHTISKYGNGLIVTLVHMFVAAKQNFSYFLSSQNRAGLLRLAGYIGSDELSTAIFELWKLETTEDKIDLLGDYLWAGARCCGKQPAILLDPVLDTWGKLSDQPKGEDLPSERASIVTISLHQAFEQHVPYNAIEYLVTATAKEELLWPIIYLLSRLDHPLAVACSANYAANELREYNDTYVPFDSISRFTSRWQNKQNSNGILMSANSRTQLYTLWSNKESDKYLKEAAFRLWATNKIESDIPILQEHINDKALQTLITEQQLRLGDKTAIPQLLVKLPENSRYWWQFARYIWSDELTAALDNEFDKRSKENSSQWTDFNFDSDWITEELLRRLEPQTAASILCKHWHHLQYNSQFVLIALFIATDQLVALVAEYITKNANPATTFQYFANVFHQSNTANLGVTRQKQIEVLIPYLHLLNDTDIAFLASLCNENNWYELRKQHFDPRLFAADATLAPYLNDANIINSLNELAAHDSSNSNQLIEGWVDCFLKTGETQAKVVETVLTWLRSQNPLTDKVIFIALDVIIHIGNRAHFEELLEICTTVKASYAAIFENAYFLLKTRQLN